MERSVHILNRIHEFSKDLAIDSKKLIRTNQLNYRDLDVWGTEGTAIERLAKRPLIIAAKAMGNLLCDKGVGASYYLYKAIAFVTRQYSSASLEL